MKKTLLTVAAMGVVGLATGCAVYAHDSGARTAQADAPATRTVVHIDRFDAESAAELAEFSDHIVSGSFVKIVKTGTGSAYGMGGTLGEASDPAVNIWQFHVDEVIKGGSPTDVLVARYDAAQVDSDEAAVSPGMDAVLFLSAEHNGARVVVGGDQGLLRRSPDGGLSPVSPEVKPLPDGGSEKSLKAAVE